MHSINLELVAPSTHCINRRRGEKDELATLSGHVTVSADSTLPWSPCRSIHVKLFQTLNSTSDKSCRTKATSRRYSFDKSRIFCPSFFSSTAQASEAKMMEGQTVEIVSLPCSLEGTPEEHSGTTISKYYFSLQVPATIPATTETPSGSVTYTIFASATSEDHQPTTKSQSVKLYRQTTREDATLIRTALSFPLSKLIKGMALIQQSNTKSEPVLSFTATIAPRWQTSPGQRTSDMKHLVVRELRWYAEEVVRVMSQPHDGTSNKFTICKSEMTRHLCKGRVKGYWGPDQNPHVKQTSTITQDEDITSLIHIDFCFSYPKCVALIDEIGLECYEFGTADDVCPPPYSPSDLGFHMDVKRAIIVQHQLKFEIITGEDTFDTKTKSLVERKPVQTTVCPAFPFTVREISR